MYKNTLTSILAISLLILTGCNDTVKDGARFQVNPAKQNIAVQQGFNTPDAQEVDLVEDMAAKRMDYFNSLNKLEQFYLSKGNQTKRMWAQKELRVLGSAPQYKYLMSAEIARSDFAAAQEIPEADQLFSAAEKLNSKGRAVGVPVNSVSLRSALAKYNQLIQQYPTSDKADDAAYKAGEIYQFFGDWGIAATYYQRTFQWNPKTQYPARFKAAWIMDYKLKRKSEALTLYRMAYEQEKNFPSNSEFARKRIIALTSNEDKYEAKAEIKGKKAAPIK